MIGASLINAYTSYWATKWCKPVIFRLIQSERECNDWG